MMVSPLSGRDEGQLIEIKTPYFNFYIKGELRDLSNTKVDETDEAIYQLTCKDEIELTITDVVTSKEKQLFFTGMPLFFEQTSYQIIIEGRVGHQIIFDHDSRLIREKIGPIGNSGLIAGVINFGNEVGMTQFRILVDGSVYLRLNIEVYPTKIGYKSDYKQLRDDVAKEIYNLTFDFMRTTYLKADLVKSDRPSLTEFYGILSGQFDELLGVIALIIKQPYHELQTIRELRSYRNGAYISREGVKYLNKHPYELQYEQKQFIPKKYLYTHKQHTTDVYENQFVKYMVLDIIKKLECVEKEYCKLERDNDQQLMSEFRKKIEGLKNKLNRSFFSRVSELKEIRQFSVVMQMSPIYRKFYKIYLRLQMGLSICAGIFNLSNKEIAQLYEYWCFIKLGALLKEKNELIEEQTNLRYHGNLFVTLQKGRISTLRFKHNQTGQIFTLAYNASYTTPTVSQKPDNMLSLKRDGKGSCVQYVIDAKYRVDYKGIGDKQVEVPKESDINTMHRYRDAIVYKNKQGSYARSVVGAIVLFPGSESELYKSTRFYESIINVNIGGLPFLPSNTSLVKTFLDELVDQMIGKEQEEIPRQVHKEEIDYREMIEEEPLVAEGVRAETIYHTIQNKD